MLRQFLSYYKPYKWLFSATFLSAILASLLELAFPLALNRVIDDLLPTGQWQTILYACFGLVVIYGLSAILHFVVTYYGHRLGINIETDMREQAFNHVQKLSFRFFDDNKTGHLVSRMTNDLMDIGEVAHHGPEDFFIAFITFMGSFALMLSIHWKLAVLTCVIVPFLVGLSIYFSRKMSIAFGQMFKNIADFNAQVENNVSGIRVVQAFSNEEHEINRFAEKNERFRKTKIATYRAMAWNTSVSHILMKSISIFVLACGTWFVIQESMTFGEFMAFIVLSNIFLNPIQKINSVIEMYPKGVEGFRRYQELLNTSPDVQNREGSKTIDRISGLIRYEDVSFTYEGNDRLLDDLNFTVYPGETVALVGPSGGGKTTICNLLPRFYDVTAGQITIDGIDIRDMTLQSLRQHIGIVQQDVFLFDGTVRENIAYGKLDATEEEIWQAARQAQMNTFIASMPEGLNTMIGERGVKLSGGQKQRLAIARTFLKNPSILILDEATSALDTETEAAIQEALDKLSAGRTTIVIAHRLATIRTANRILVISEEGVEEQGTHEQLLSSGGSYQRLHQAQYSV